MGYGCEGGEEMGYGCEGGKRWDMDVKRAGVAKSGINRGYEIKRSEMLMTKIE